MLKIKLVETLAQKKRVIVAILLVVLLIGLGSYALHKYSQHRAAEKAAEVKQLNNQAVDLQVKGDYESAAKKQIKAYGNISNGTDKAVQAEDIAGVYESSRDYAKALTWYKEALSKYQALGDKESVNDIERSIQRVESYMKPSAPVKQQEPTDSGG